MNKRLLVSLMIIGLVAAGLGGTTIAVFNDSETSADNQFVAGELDLQIDWEESYNGEQVETQELTNDPGAIFELEDLKPGDHGEATVSLHLDDNPGWIWMNFNQTSNWDNACTEPERKAEGQCGSEGELGEHLMFTIWSDDGDNVLQEDENVIFEGTAHELSEQSQISEGLLLDSDPSTEEVEAFPASETKYTGIKWEIPLETGNEIQGDSKTFDIGFYTEQERHNPQEPETPEEPGNETEPPEEPPTNDSDANDTVENGTDADLKAISFVSFCTVEDQESNQSGEQTPSEPCPANQSQLVKFEWTGNTFEAEGDSEGISINPTNFKENDTTELIEADWTSSTDIETTVVKSGQQICNYPGGVQGTVESCTSEP